MEGERRAIDLATDAVERTTDAVVVFDRGWRFAYVNRAGEAYYGRRRAELLGRVVWELFPAVLGTDVEVNLRRAMRDAAPIEFALRSPATQRWVEVRTFPAPDGLAVYFRDVTARKLAEEELRAAEVRQRLLFENSLVGVCLTAPDGRIFRVNAAACHMLGRSEDEIVRLGRAGVVDESDPRFPGFLEERARTGRARAELRLVRADGTTFPAEVHSAVFRDERSEARTSLQFVDVTERLRAQTSLELLSEAGAALAASLDLDATLANVTRLLVPRLADLCFVDLLDDRGELRRAAAAHRDPERLGEMGALPRMRMNPRRAGVLRVLETGEPELVPVITDAWLEAAAMNEEHLLRLRRLGPRSLLIVPLRARGRTLGTLAMTILDDARRYGPGDLPLALALADRAAVAIDNARVHADAVEAKRLRDDVLGVVSHDLRSPLHAIRLSAEVLARQHGGPPAPELARIRRSVDRANRLIEDLLTAARIDAGTLPLERADEPIAALLDEVVEAHAPLAAEKSITLSARVAPGVERAFFDHRRLAQLLGNLVGNAIKFTPEGGRIELRARPLDGYDGAAGAAGVAIDVEDSGAGIAPEDLAHLFDRFWQGAHARRAGAGLGLAIAKGIAEAHGGQLSVESAVGRGSTFTLSLPHVAPIEHSAA